MHISALTPTGNSSKFHVETKSAAFDLALSFTLRKKIWQLDDEAAELSAASELAEAIVSRHDPATPFKTLYVLAEHNTLPTVTATVASIRQAGWV